MVRISGMFVYQVGVGSLYEFVVAVVDRVKRK